MPRITDARREARRSDIVAAARRCFARDGFHQTSMPDIAKEAGLSAGAFYRYFASKDDVVVEVAGEAFGMMFGPIEELTDERPAAGDLVAAASDGATASDELLRCAVQAWSELLRNDVLRERALAGFERVRAQTAEALRRGQAAGSVRADLDPEAGARVLMALLHGFLLQSAAFELTDVEAFVRAARTLLDQRP